MPGYGFRVSESVFLNPKSGGDRTVVVRGCYGTDTRLARRSIASQVSGLVQHSDLATAGTPQLQPFRLRHSTPSGKGPRAVLVPLGPCLETRQDFFRQDEQDLLDFLGGLIQFVLLILSKFRPGECVNIFCPHSHKWLSINNLPEFSSCTAATDGVEWRVKVRGKAVGLRLPPTVYCLSFLFNPNG